MENIDYLLEFFEKKTEIREKILKFSRDIVRDSGLIIRKIQKDENVDFKEIESKLLTLSSYNFV